MQHLQASNLRTGPHTLAGRLRTAAAVSSTPKHAWRSVLHLLLGRRRPGLEIPRVQQGALLCVQNKRELSTPLVQHVRHSEKYFGVPAAVFFICRSRQGSANPIPHKRSRNTANSSGLSLPATFFSTGGFQGRSRPSPSIPSIQWAGLLQAPPAAANPWFGWQWEIGGAGVGRRCPFGRQAVCPGTVAEDAQGGF